MNEDFNKIIMVMRQCYGKDISVYDNAFLEKTLERRWLATGVLDASQYCRYLEENSTEADELVRSLHINFSQFFRDPLAFALLEQKILPEIVANKPIGSEIRIWSAGCACGQEAYSIAMLLCDLSFESGSEHRFRIFATDITEEALLVAEAGVFDQSAVQDVKKKHLDRYFLKQDKTYTIVPQLRQCISFSTYDLLDEATANPPESIYGDFDIVLCCNLLIYYSPNLQQAIIKKLQQAMSANGYLITGEAEKTRVEAVSRLSRVAIPTAVFKNNKSMRM